MLLLLAGIAHAVFVSRRRFIRVCTESIDAVDIGNGSNPFLGCLEGILTYVSSRCDSNMTRALGALLGDAFRVDALFFIRPPPCFSPLEKY
jgi:hypothetical protein